MQIVNGFNANFALTPITIGMLGNFHAFSIIVANNQTVVSFSLLETTQTRFLSLFLSVISCDQNDRLKGIKQVLVFTFRKVSL